MHLRAHDVNLAAPAAEVAHLLKVIFGEVIVVDVQLRLFRENALGDFECPIGIVARHRAIPALAQLRTGDHSPLPEIGGALVDHIPAVDLVAVPYGDLHDPLRSKNVKQRGVFRKSLRHLFGGHLLEGV